MIKRALLLVLAISLLAPALANGAVTRIEQVSEGCSALKLYVSLAQDSGEGITDLQPGEMSFSLDNRPLKVDSQKLFSQTGEGMAITLLLDCSRSMGNKGQGGAEPFAMAKQAARSLISAMGPRDVFSIFSVGDSVRLVQPFTSDKAQLIKSLDSMRPTAKLTMLYEALRRAIEINGQGGKGIPERRAVIVISDGKDEGSGITLDDVLQANQHAAVPFFAIGFTRVEPAHLSNLKRLALKTGGLYVSSPTPGSIVKALPAIKKYFNNSYTVVLKSSDPLEAKLSVLRAEFDRGGTKSEAVREVLLTGKPSASAAAEEDAAAQGKGLKAVWRNHKALVLGGGAAVVLLLAGAILLLARKRKARRRAAEAAHAEAQARAQELAAAANSAASQSCGRLTVVASDAETVPVGLSFPLDAENVLGRGNDSSIVLNDAKVSRRHCRIERRGGVCVASDLGSTNGTKVNDAVISAPTVLRGGDILTLGRIGLRFDEAQGA